MSKNKIPIKLIKLYQKNKKIIGTGHCRFYPTCSHYALESYQKFNFFYASWLTFYRIIRCNYLTRRKYDPVPLTKKEKQRQKELELIFSSSLSELASILIMHYRRYPLSQANDFIKLIYQSYYGPKHLVTINEEIKIINYIQDEIKTITTPNYYLLDYIGNGLVRVDLRLIESQQELKQFALAFFNTCSQVALPAFSFQDGINLLKRLIKIKAIHLEEDFDKIEDYQKNPHLPHHSQVYTDAYLPHYRLIKAKLIPFDFYLKAISIIIKHKMMIQNRLIIAIEGPAGSGKSTLAKVLKTKFGAEIYHVDDFFLPLKMKTKKRLKQVGGNIHYERLLKELIIPLKKKKPFFYQKYDCTKHEYIMKLAENKASIIIIEGVYSAHPLLINHYDLLFYVDIDKNTQNMRLKKRSEELYNRFVQEWLPLEEIYFNYYHIKTKADLIINGSMILNQN